VAALDHINFGTTVGTGLDPPAPGCEGGTVKTVPYIPEAGLEIAGVTPDLIWGRNDGNRRAFGGRTQFATTGNPEWVWRGEDVHHATVGRDTHTAPSLRRRNGQDRSLHN